MTNTKFDLETVTHGAVAGAAVAFLEDFATRLVTGVLVAVLSSVVVYFVKRYLPGKKDES